MRPTNDTDDDIRATVFDTHIDKIGWFMGTKCFGELQCLDAFMSETQD